MKINFGKIKFRPTLGDKEDVCLDVIRIIADVLWNSDSVGKGCLGLRIYENMESEIELSEMECAYIKEEVLKMRQWVRVPILKAIGEDIH